MLYFYDGIERNEWYIINIRVYIIRPACTFNTHIIILEGDSKF